MSKQSWQSEPKVADLKRIDVEIKVKKQKKNKKVYPPHWEIRKFGIIESKVLRTSKDWKYDRIGYYFHTCDEYKLAYTLFKEGDLDGMLEIYTKHHPETKNWPVRFINIPKMETIREVLD